MPKSIRRIATTRNMATPRATARINVRFGMDGTCWARTCKSGSDIVIKKPITKLTKITIKRFLDLVMMVPVLSPIGVMDTSTPTLKNNIPIINKMAPIKKVIRILGGIGAMVKQREKEKYDSLWEEEEEKNEETVDPMEMADNAEAVSGAPAIVSVGDTMASVDTPPAQNGN